MKWLKLVESTNVDMPPLRALCEAHRMDHVELEALLKDIESDRVERTVSLNDTTKFGEAICAFANDMPNHNRPGYLFVGCNPDGTSNGSAITDQLLQNLSAIRSDGHVQPLPTMNVQKWPLGGGEMAVVEVFPSDQPPVRYKGRIHIRVGPRRAIANEGDERRLMEKRVDRTKTWDARPCYGASLDDLALDLFMVNYRLQAVAREVLAENNRSVEIQLASLRFFDLKNQLPTNAGVLLFGKDPVSFFDGAFVQYVRYEGDSQAADVALERRFSGDFLTLLRELDQFTDEVAGAKPIAISDTAERIVFDYPPKALHELLMNAAIHRNYDGSTTPIMISHYSDRIEILNPGGLYGELTPEQFPLGTAYRNPVLAEAAKTLGFVNRFGRGIGLTQELLKRNGSSELSFSLQPSFFLVSIKRRP
jgi:ATP-dependent DNA helicase RecG